MFSRTSYSYLKKLERSKHSKKIISLALVLRYKTVELVYTKTLYSDLCQQSLIMALIKALITVR